MRKTTRTRVLPILLTLMMVLALVPATATAADIQAGTPTITPNIGIDTGTVVGFAGQEWWVIGYNSTGVYSSGTNNVTLLLKSTSNPYGNTAFRTGQITTFPDSTLYSDGIYYADNPSGTNWTNPNEYRGSTLQQKMESIGGDIDTASPKEYDLINPRTLTAADDTNYQITGGDVAGQKLWALSYDEAHTINSKTVRSYEYWWWLRTPGSHYSMGAARVNQNGITVSDTDRVSNRGGCVRPAFNLNLSSVIFTSAASGAGEKSNATAGSTLTSATAPSGSIKVTMEDNSVAPGFTASATARSGDTYTITYANAATDANKSISAIVMRGGVMTHYGQLVHPASASGTTTVTLPTGFDPATDTLKVFAEELNSDDYTDFATTPITIDTTSPTLTNANFVERTSDTAGEISATSNEAGTVYYKAVADATSVTQPTVIGDLSSWTSAGTIAAGTATQYGVALAAGAQDVYVVAVDAAGNISSQSKVDFAAYAVPPTYVAPTITTTSLPSGKVGTAYSQTLAATGDTPITWSVTSGSLPAGLTLSGNTISGTPTTAGTSSFTVQASNGVSPNAAAAFSIMINPPPPSLVMSTLTNDSALVGQAYSKTVSYTYTNGVSPITFSATGLPSGISINTSTGVISGTPTTDGVSNVTVTVTDGTLTASQSYTLTIVPATYTITATAGTGGSISPSGGVTTAYGANQTFTITSNADYSISSVLVDGISVGAVSSYTFSSVAANHTIAVTFTYTPTVYSVLIHFDDFTGSGTSSARVDADHTKFLRLLKDGSAVDTRYYTITQGSTIITFNEAYLRTLANGTHWYTAEYSDGTSENIQLLVDVAATSTPTTNSPNTAIPKTGDSSLPPVLLASFLGLAGVGLLGISGRRRSSVGAHRR